MKIILKKCIWPKNKKRTLKRRIKKFIENEKIKNVFETITIDWKTIGTVNTMGGYYGGLSSIYSKRKAYINLTVFYELENIHDINGVLWAIFHELIHCRQIYNKEIIISKDRNSLIYKNKKYEKLSFRGSQFVEYYKEDRFKATEYHIKEIPWEGECYYKSDLYTGIRSFNHEMLKNVA